MAWYDCWAGLYMIGVGYLQTSGGVASTEFTAEISPPSVTATTPNGGYTSPLFTVSTANEVGPLEYLWESTTPDFEVFGSPTESVAVFQASGFDELKVTGIICTVTDTGQGSITRQPFSFLSITFT